MYSAIYFILMVLMLGSNVKLLVAGLSEDLRPLHKPWQSTTLILSCAGSSQGLLLGGYARNVMVSVWSAIPMSDHAHWWESVMSATTVHSKEDVSYVEVLGSQMPTTAKSVLSRRRIEMDAQKLWIWGVPKQIFSMNERNMDLRKDDGKSGSTFSYVHDILMLNFGVVFYF